MICAHAVSTQLQYLLLSDLSMLDVDTPVVRHLQSFAFPEAKKMDVSHINTPGNLQWAFIHTCVHISRASSALVYRALFHRFTSILTILHIPKDRGTPALPHAIVGESGGRHLLCRKTNGATSLIPNIDTAHRAGIFPLFQHRQKNNRETTA